MLCAMHCNFSASAKIRNLKTLDVVMFFLTVANLRGTRVCMQLFVASFHSSSACILASKAAGGDSEFAAGPEDTEPGNLVCVAEAKLHQI